MQNAADKLQKFGSAHISADIAFHMEYIMMRLSKHWEIDISNTPVRYL